MADHFRPFLTSLWSAAAFFQQIVINCYRFYSLEMLLMGKGEYDRHVFSLKLLTMSYCTNSFGVSTLHSRIPKLHSLLTPSWQQFNDKGGNLSTFRGFFCENGVSWEIDLSDVTACTCSKIVILVINHEIEMLPILQCFIISRPILHSWARKFKTIPTLELLTMS